MQYNLSCLKLLISQIMDGTMRFTLRYRKFAMNLVFEISTVDSKLKDRFCHMAAVLIVYITGQNIWISM